MQMHKALTGVEIKDADQGLVTAVFSTFGVIDLDGDVVHKDAFKGKDGKRVPVSAFGHASWEGAPPVGVAVVKVTDNEAVADMQLNLKTQAGRETFEVIKQMGELQEYSWGFTVKHSDPEEVEGKSVRVIKDIDIHEVSPVLIGAAGPGRTRTLAVKGEPGPEVLLSYTPTVSTSTTAGKTTSTWTTSGFTVNVPPVSNSNTGKGASDMPRAIRGAIPAHETEALTKSWNGTKTVEGLPGDARPSELRTVYAWVDPDGDPECKSSYRFPHHHGVAGPANLRACLLGIATLNSDEPGVPDEDREAVHKHLSEHLLSADREAPELRTAGEKKSKQRFNDEVTDVMASVSNVIDRASEVVALRREKGKGMSPIMAEHLSWLVDDLKRLESLLETPVEEDAPKVEEPSEEDIASVVMAALARLQGM